MTVSSALSGGEPSSVTSTVTVYTPGTVGVHEKAPVRGSILAPAGAPGLRP